MANERQERPDGVAPVSTPAVVSGVLEWEEEVTPDEHGRLWSKVLEYYLGVHEG